MPTPKITNIFWLGFGLALIAAAGWASTWAGPDVPKTLPAAAGINCRTFGAPKIVRFELAGSASSAEALTHPASSGERASRCTRAILNESLRRDSVFILSYIAAIAWFCAWGARRFRSTKLRVLGWMAIAITVVAAGFDVVENAFLGSVLDGNPDAARYATAASLAKWALLVVPVVYALGSLMTLVVRWFANGTITPHEPSHDDAWKVTAGAPDRLRSIRGDTILAGQYRAWWASRPPCPGAWDQPPPEHNRVVGVAFSGGGIRSASFQLGVIERLTTLPYPEKRGLLDCLTALPGPPRRSPDKSVLARTRYLASVSGGGYLATAHQITVHQANAAIVPPQPPAAADAFGPGSREQKFVVERRLYLWDTMWLRCLGMAKIFLGIAINLALFTALIYIAARPIGWFAGSYLYVGTFGLGSAAALWLPAAALALAAFVGFWFRGLASVVGECSRAFATCCGVASGVLLLLGLATLSTRRSVAILAVATVAVAIVGSFTARRVGNSKLTGFLFTGVGALLAAIAVGLARLWVRGAAVDRLAHSAHLDTQWFRVLVLFVALYAVAIPVVFFVVECCPPRLGAGVPSALAGMVIVVGSWWLAGRLRFDWRVPELIVWGVWALALGIALCFVDQRLWSPHVFYKRRLLHTFSPIRTNGDDGSADCGEDIQLSMGVRTDLEIWAKRVTDQPELLVCAAVHLPGTTFGNRPAGSFTFSHAIVGGPDVGWVPTPEFRESLRNNMVKDGTLGAAAAISGAAIAAANGYMRLGAANSALALLNARLGVWLPNPTHVHELEGRRTPVEGGTGVWVGHRNIGYSLKEVFGHYDPLDRFVYVSDGGHHDNLGLIELLRRRCKIIVCFDASGDKDGTVNTFLQVQTRANLELDVRLTPEDAKEDDALQRGAARIAVYKIEYPKLAPPPGIEGEALAAQHGWLVFAKCELLVPGGETFPCSDEQVGVFPRDSTAHQWFSEERLLQYRALGATVADEAVARLPGLMTK